MSLKQQKQIDALQAQVDALQAIFDLPTRSTKDGTEWVPVSVAGTEYKMLSSIILGNGFKTKDANYSATLSDANSVLTFTGNSRTYTIPDDLGWSNGDFQFIIQRGTSFSIDATAVTVESPQTLSDVQHSVYLMRKVDRVADKDVYNINQIGTATGGGGGGGETNTASNVGTDGVGVFKIKNGVNLEFKNIAPGSNKITVVANVDDIDLDVDESNFDVDSMVEGASNKFLTVAERAAIADSFQKSTDDTDDITEGTTNKFTTAARLAIDISLFETTTQLNARDTANRDRANHTGTQPASTISDFDAEVSNNTSVAANTAKVGVTTEEANTIDSVTAGEPTGSDQILNVVSLTTAEYTAGTKVATTLYIITDA